MNHYRNPANASRDYLFSMNNFQGIRPASTNTPNQYTAPQPPHAQNQYALQPPNAQNQYAPHVGFVFPGSNGGQWMPSGYNQNPSQPISQPSTSSLSVENQNGDTSKQAPKKKVPGWSEPETLELIEAWGAKFDKLKSASKREKVKIWNTIYEVYTKAWGSSERTLPQIKKRIQNLEYEFNNLKQKARLTGEEGLKKIKEGFPYYDTMDELTGHRDNIDPDNMQVEGSSVFAEASEISAESDRSTPTSAASSTPTSDTSTATETPKTSKGKGPAKKAKRRRRDDDDEEKWGDKMMEVFERGMKEDNARFERCMEAFKESQKEQMQQTKEILAGFKGIFAELLKKD